MIEDMSDREKELLQWNMFLVDVINRYSIFFGLINRDCNWLDDIWKKDDIKSKQDDLINFLRIDYGLEINASTNIEEILGNEKD